MARRRTIRTLILARWLLNRGITASTYLAATALLVLVSISFAIVYREGFAAFLGQQQHLQVEQLQALSEQLQPGLEPMGMHTTLRTVAPSDARLVDYEIMIDQPPLQRLAQEIQPPPDGRPARVAGFGIVRAHHRDEEYLYVIARLDVPDLRSRTIGKEALAWSDYFVIRYATPTGKAQHRLIAYEELSKPIDFKIAQAAGYISTKEMRPTVKDGTQDNEIRGGAYLQDDQLYVLLRLRVYQDGATGQRGPDTALFSKQLVTIAWGSSLPSVFRYVFNERNLGTSLCETAARIHARIPAGIQSLNLLLRERPHKCPIAVANQKAAQPDNARSWSRQIHVWLAKHIARSSPETGDDVIATEGVIRATATLDFHADVPARIESDRSLLDVIEAWQANSRALLTSFTVSVVGIALLTVIFHFMVLRRIQRLSAMVSKKKKDGSFTMLESKPYDEIGVLAHRFNVVLKLAQWRNVRLERANDTLEAQSNQLRDQYERLTVANKQLSTTADHIRHNVQQPIEQLRSYVKHSPRANQLFEAALRATKEVVKDQSISSDTRPRDLHEYARVWCANVSEEIPEIDLHYSAPTGEVWAHADENALEDTLSRILSNARDFRAPATPLTVWLTVEEAHAVLHFHNCGACIAESDITKIFDDQFSTRASTATGHMGLGLYEARRFMRAMGGQLSAVNTPDGVEFQLRFLLAQAPVKVSSSQ